MKKLITKVVCFYIVMSMVACGEEYDDSRLNGRIDNLENRVETLEEFCKQMNTNISSLQLLITALQQNDYITNLSEVHQGDKVIGYTVSFSKSKSITIYHGKDGIDGKDGVNGQNGKDGANGKDGVNGQNGKDGANGKDGKDGASPLVGVKLHFDGYYYWTIDGEWLKDQEGNMIKAQGRDGVNGNDGQDGITPKLKIENGYWYISYDEGYLWVQLGEAKGENGDNIFKDIIVGNEFITFILIDGNKFQLPLYYSSHLTIEVEEVGTLKRLLTAEQKRDLISLSVIGKINQIDINTIEYQLQNLESLDLSKAYYIDETLSFDRNDIINGKLKQLALPCPTLQHNRQQGTKMRINVAQYINLEKIIIPSDTIVSSIYKSGTNNESISIDSLIVNEGVTVGYERSCYANAPYVVLPSTIKQLHSLAFGWGTDEEFRKLKTLICKAVLPPGIGEWYYKDGVKYFNNFMDSYSGNDWHHASECKLIVPAESVELYKQAKYWKNFGIIIPLDE